MILSGHAPLSAGRLMAVPDQNDQVGYLHRVESLAHEVVDCAANEGWLSYAPDPGGATQLQRAVNELARNLRHVHYDGDGCLDQ
jgi:hypothetical protein